MTGKVKFFNKAKGYGFIQKSDGSGDLFFHVSQVKETEPKSLKEDELVNFEISQGTRGLEAVEVTRQS